MSKSLLYGLFAVIVLIHTIPLAGAWSWSDSGNNNYTRAINFSNINFTYTPNYTTAVGTYPPGNLIGSGRVKTIIISIPTNQLNGAIGAVNFEGYNPFGRVLGAVGAMQLNTNSPGITRYLVNTSTFYGTPYTNLTMFYWPIGFVYSSTYYKMVTQKVGGILTINEYTGGGFSYQVSNTASVASISINYPSSPSPSPAMVIYSNRTLVGTAYNITYWPDFQTHSQFNDTPNGYSLETLGTFGTSQVTSNAPVSGEMELIYGSGTNGMDFYMGPAPSPGYATPQSPITEGMMINDTAISSSGGMIYNAFIGESYYLNYLNFLPNEPNIKIPLAIRPLSITILPAFTSNYIMGNVLHNTNPGANQSLYNYPYFIPVNDITWNSVWTTDYANSITNIIYSGSNVLYLELNITEYAETSGSACSISNCGLGGIYMDVVAGNTGQLGGVPFHVSQLSPQNGLNRLSLLVSATSLYGYYQYNALRIYYGGNDTFAYGIFGGADWPNGNSNNGQNIYTQWRIGAGHSFSTIGAATPYFISPAGILPKSQIYMFNTTTGGGSMKGSAYYTFNTEFESINMSYSATSTAGVCGGHVSSGFNPGVINVNPNPVSGWFLSYSLGATWSGVDTLRLINATHTYGPNGNQCFEGALNMSKIVLNASQNGFAYYPYTTISSVGSPNYNIAPPSNNSGVNPRTIIPPPPGCLSCNTTNSTTIPYPTAKDQIFAGLSIPVYAVVTLFIFGLVTIGLLLKDKNKSNIGFLGLMALLAIIGIYQAPALVVAFILTILYIAFEFLRDRGE